MASALRNLGKKRATIRAKEKAEENDRRGALLSLGKTRDDDEKNRGGLLGGAGYLLGSTALGLGSVVEGATDIVTAAGDLLRGDTDMAKYRFQDNKMADAQEKLRESYNPGTVMGYAGDVTSGIGTSLTFMIPYVGPYLAAAGFVGQGISKGAEKTGDVGLKEIGYGLATGGMEFGLEALTAGMGSAAKNIGASVARKIGRETAESAAKTVGREALESTAKAAGKKAGKLTGTVTSNAMWKSVLKETVKGFAGEFIEEAAAEAIDPFLQRTFNIDENARADWGQIAYAGLIGGISGGLMSAGPAAINYQSAVKTGRMIRKSGETEDVLKHAETVLAGANRAKTRLESKPEQKNELGTDAGFWQKTTAKAKDFSANRKNTKAKNSVASLSDKVSKNLNAYRTYYENPNKSEKELEASDALLGEMFGNVFALENATLLDVYEEAILEATEEDKEALVREFNERARAAGAKKHDYTVKDMEDNSDDILTAIAARRMQIDEYGLDFVDNPSPGKASQADAEAAQAQGSTEAANAPTTPQMPVTAPTEAAEAAQGTEGLGAVKQPTNQQTATEKEDEGLTRLKAKASEMGLGKIETDMMASAYSWGSDLSPEDYAVAYAEGVYYGKQNRRLGDIPKDAAFSRLSTTEKENALQAGRLAVQADTERREALAAKKNAPAREAGKKSYVTLELKNGKRMRDLSDRDYATYKAAAILGEAMGTEIVITDTLGDNEAGKINGYYDRDGRIHIALDAGRDAKGTALYTLAHEATHAVREWSPTEYQKLSDFVGARMGESMTELIEKKKPTLRKMEQYRTATEADLTDAAQEEVVADAMETILSDGTVLEELAAYDQTLWEKVKAWINEVISRIKAHYKNLSPNSQAAKVLADSMDSLTELQEMFATAARKTGERTKAAERSKTAEKAKNESSDTTIRFSLMNELSLNENVDQVMTMDDNTAIAKKAEDQYISIMSDTPSIITKHVEDAENLEIVMRFDSFYLATRHEGALEGHYHNYGETMKKLPEIISDPEAIVRMDNDRLNLLAKVQTSKGNHSVVSIELNTVKDINSKFKKYNLVVSVVPAKDNYMRNNLLKHGIKVEYEKEDLSQVNHQLYEWLAIVNDKSSARSISQESDSVNRKFSISEENLDETYMSAVTEGDMETAQRLVDEAATRAGYLNLFYHGSKKGGDFTVFRDWSYFTENREYAKRYMDRDKPGSLYKTYVKMEHPFDTRKAQDREIFAKIRDEYGLGEIQDTGLPDWTDGYDIADYIDETELEYDGIILDEGGDLVNGEPVSRGLSYVVKKSVQIKSADPVTYDDDGNIIPLSERFQETNPDIRYSIEDSDTEPPDVSETPFDAAVRRMYERMEADEAAKFKSEIEENADPETEPVSESESQNAEMTDVERAQAIRDHVVLANAMLTAVQSEEEYRIVKNYKEKAADLADAEIMLGELRRKTAEVNRELETLRAKVRGVEKSKREVWVMTEIDEAVARKTEYIEEMNRLSAEIKKEESKLLSLASTKPLRKALQEANRKANAMERSAERAREREEETREWAKDTVRKERAKASERIERAEQDARDYKAAIHKTSMDRVYKARRDAREYKTAVYTKAYEKANEKIKKNKETLDRKADESKERKEITTRKRTVMRILGSLETKIYHPTKTNHVPQELYDLAMKTLRAADPKAFEKNRSNIREMGELTAKIERLERKAARTSTEQKTLDSMKSKYEHLEKETLPLKRQAEALMTAFAEYNEGVPEGLQYPPEILKVMQNSVAEIENEPLAKMTLSSLKAVETFVTMLSHKVDSENKLFMRAREQTVSDTGDIAVKETLDSKELKFLSPKPGEIASLDGIRKYFWKNMKPLTVFDAIGSKTFTSLFNEVLRGEDVWAQDIMEARGKILDARKRHGYDKWKLDERRVVKTASGDVRLSLSEIMALYAYSFREQAINHLEGGGFVLDPGATEVASGKRLTKPQLERRLNDSTHYVMNAETAGELAAMLTDEQKAYVEEMQGYLTGLGEKGNTVSRKLYGIDLFTEKHYFPIKVQSEYIASNAGPSGDPNIKNRGMTKEVVPNAKDPLVLQGFDEIMVDHINSMATYHAFVLPVEDLTRVLNYKPSNAKVEVDGKWVVDETKKDEPTLKDVIKSKYGKQADDYIVQLLRDLNGGARRDAAAGLIDRGITAFKRASTMASLSVLVQQPTSIFRAMAYLDGKYLFGGTAGINVADHKKLWEKVKKYAPVAIIKEMGGYDTGVGARTGDFLNSKEYKTWNDKLQAFIKPERFGGDANYRSEVFGAGAAFADEMAWIQIFEGCVSEQASKLGKSRDAEEVLQAAGKRFEEIIRKTQVYDSTLSRSEYMRAKDTGAKMATAFMAEPTTVVSMMADAIIRGERGDTKFLRKSAGVVAVSILMNALASSLIYAARDDDEDETYAEKYTASLARELVDGVNPATYLPVARDVVSIMQGYEVERSDMTLIQNLIDKVEGITNSKRSVSAKMVDVGGAVAAFFGVPVTNVVRDARGLYNTFLGQVDTETTTGIGISTALKKEFTTIFGLFDEQTTDAYQLYRSALNEDGPHFARVYARYKDTKAAELALRQAIRDNDRRIAKAAEAKISGELEAFESIVEQIVAEGHFDRNIIIRAVNNEVSAIRTDMERATAVPRDEAAAAEVEDEERESLYSAADLNDALQRGDTEDYEIVYYTLLADKKERGQTEAQAKASVKSSVTAFWKKRYLAAWEENDTAEMKRIQAVLLSTGLYGKRNDVAVSCENWVKAYAKKK